VKGKIFNTLFFPPTPSRVISSHLTCLYSFCSYGIAWSALREGHVISASEDTTICHWWVLESKSDKGMIFSVFNFIETFTIFYEQQYRDIQGYDKTTRVMDPLHIYRGHTAVVEVWISLIYYIFMWFDVVPGGNTFNEFNRLTLKLIDRMLLGIQAMKPFSLLWEMTKNC